MILPSLPTASSFDPLLKNWKRPPEALSSLQLKARSHAAIFAASRLHGSQLMSAKHCVACWKRPDASDRRPENALQRRFRCHDPAVSYNFVVAFTTLTTGIVWSLRL